jgi:hypothetical protein
MLSREVLKILYAFLVAFPELQAISQFLAGEEFSGTDGRAYCT